MSELKENIGNLSVKIQDAKKLLDLSALETEVKVLEAEMSEEGFWNNPDHARSIAEKAGALRQEIETWHTLEREVVELEEMEELAREGDDALLRDVERKYEELRKRFEALEFMILLGEEYDRNNAILAIHAGAGGVDSQDWAEMLFRMFSRYAESKGWRVRIMNESRGQEAGIKSLVCEIVGAHAYGYLKSEAGVHRLVRISPFDAEAMRHTSFALVEVLPDFGDAPPIEIKDEDLKIDVFRSSGHGGQSVNTTDSAVRITHLPSGITVGCQNERSQHQNKAFAMKMLAAKLMKLEQQNLQAEKQKIRGEFTSAEWGNQIRSYVLHPYKLVKDHRTNYEETDPDAVLNGKLDNFIEAFLRKSV